MTWEEMTPEQQNTSIAEKVMGWQPKPCDLEETDGELTIYDNGDACCPRCSAYEHISSLKHGMIPPPHYNTSMDAAWQVLQKMAMRWSAQDEYVDEPFARFVGDLLPNSGGEIWTAWECMANNIARWTPEAICRAAYEALMRMEPEPGQDEEL